MVAKSNGDYATALWHIKPIAEQGYAPAQYELAMLYHYGYGVTKDYKEAVRWYRKAAKQGNASAYQLNPRPTLS